MFSSTPRSRSLPIIEVLDDVASVVAVVPSPAVTLIAGSGMDGETDTGVLGVGGTFTVGLVSVCTVTGEGTTGVLTTGVFTVTGWVDCDFNELIFFCNSSSYTDLGASFRA